MTKPYILTLSCDDVKGIVAEVAGFLRDHGGFIVESAQFGDPSTNKFFMRTVFSPDKKIADLKKLDKNFKKIAEKFKMTWQFTDTNKKQKMLIMVSKASHCLNDLLHRYSDPKSNIEITAVASNHKDLAAMAKWYKLPFHHLPVDNKNRQKQEEKILTIMQETSSDFIALARYMQVISPETCRKLKSKAINIHHSFLPGFKGAKPYHQAYDRGVKIIGATAHYITNDLDEGPIIEQETIRVNHANTPDELLANGRDIECRVLSRAVRLHAEQRIILNGNKTVVFD